MAFAITDGTTTIVTDFPYQSGYSRDMHHRPEEIRSATKATLSLVTHRHGRSLGSRFLSEDRVECRRTVRCGLERARGSHRAADAARDLWRRPDRSDRNSARADRAPFLYFSGDTDDSDHLVALKHLDAAFVSPWLYRMVFRKSQRIDARLVVIDHHELSEKVPECTTDCTLPYQGEAIQIR